MRTLFFDVWSLVYDQPLVQRLTYRPVHDAVSAALHERPPAHLLDLGCGTALLSARLRREMPAVRIVGVDFSYGMLAQARGNVPALRAVRASAVALPFGDARFDTITCTEAFHWFPDQPAALRECRRVLVPGGRLLVALVNPLFDVLGDAAAVVSRVAGQPFYWPTRERMRALLERAGFRVDEQRRITRLPMGVMFPPVLTVASRI